METSEEERWVFLFLALADMEMAIRSISTLPKTTDPWSVTTLARDAVVSYCRPFTSCRGVVCRKHKLVPERHVPDSERDFHQELMSYRDRVFAHSDLRPLKPELFDWPDSPTGFALHLKGVGHEMLHVKGKQMLTLFRNVKKNIEEEQALLGTKLADSRPRQ
jgi:hypothetical protein